MKPPLAFSQQSNRAMVERLLGLYSRNNADSADAWTRFAPHRDRLTALVADAAGPGAARLLVLGAGNCNDLDLGRLTQFFDEIVLADIDAAALERARVRQPKSVRAKLRLLPQIDLCAGLLSNGQRAARIETDQDVKLLAERTVESSLRDLAPAYDVVLSPCVLSQIMHACYVAIGPGRPHLQGVGAAMACAHVTLMTRLLAPGAKAILATDVVSSDTYPVEELYTPDSPARALEKVVRSRSHFVGTSPAFLRAILRTDPLAGGASQRPRMVPPWLWSFSPKRTYLVYALTWQRPEVGSRSA